MTINQITILAALGLVVVFLIARQQRMARDVEEEIEFIRFEDIPSRIGPVT